MVDPFRELHPKLRRYTWHRRNPIQQARLDFFLLSESLLPSVKNCLTEASYRSDHSMVILTLKFSKFVKGRSLWKHNNSLLLDLEYIKIVKDKITDIKKQYALPIYNLDNIDNVPNDIIQFIINDQLFLDTLLMEIRGKSISYSTYRKRKQDNREKELLNLISGIEQDLSVEKIAQLDLFKTELQTIQKKNKRIYYSITGSMDWRWRKTNNFFAT